ncbi:MAG: hypothetical protein QM725_05265 [Lacibacter sp.]
MSNKKNKDSHSLRLQNIVRLLGGVSSDTLLGVAIHRVLTGKSDCDIECLLSDILSQISVNEPVMKKLLGDELVEQIKMYAQKN